MNINTKRLKANGLTDGEIERVKEYIEDAEKAGQFDNTATVMHINGAVYECCRTAALALQTVRPDVLELPATDEAWILLHSSELRAELIEMAERGDPIPQPHTLLGHALQ